MRAVLLLAALCCISAPAQVAQPTYTLVEPMKKAYGRASQDFRAIGVADYWWVGHDEHDGPWLGSKSDKGTYASKQRFFLPELSLDGRHADRHQCGFLHLNDDDRIDMVCAIGAGKGKGIGQNEVYRNDSTEKAVQLTRMPLGTGIEDETGRGRAMVPFRLANGGQAVWSVVHGVPRKDGHPNVNRIFRYEGSGTFKFSDVPSAAINVTTWSNCSVAGDLNGDGLDDLLLCRDQASKFAYADSILYLQQSDGSFVEGNLSMTNRKWRAAEIADLNSDGRMDLIVALMGGGLEIYLQGADGQLAATPFFTQATVGSVNSFAIGDLDGDGKPDIYAAIADNTACSDEFDAHHTTTDLWPDLVLSTRGADSGFIVTPMTNEPTLRGCSWLATWAGPRIVHLGRGNESTQGDNYSLKF